MPKDPQTSSQDLRRRSKAYGIANVDMDGPEEGVGQVLLIVFVNGSK
jgi:hypothetical protein